MKRFIDLSPTESKGVDDQIFKNGIELNKSAKIIANSKNYGLATSLLILSSEEVIKAILVLLHSNDCMVYELKESKEFFKFHKIRHKIAQLIEVNETILEIKKDWAKSSKTFFIIKSILQLTTKKHPILESNKRVNKLTSFNDLKNIGLYVDFRNDIVTPEMITKNEYNEVDEIVFRIINFYKKYKEVFESDIFSKENELLKSNIRLFINDALKEFSFKNLNK